jgi:hypothetical protein
MKILIRYKYIKNQDFGYIIYFNGIKEIWCNKIGTYTIAIDGFGDKWWKGRLYNLKNGISE